MAKSKKKKVIAIVGISLVAFLGINVIGAYVAGNIVLRVVFNRRFTTEEDLTSNIEYRVEKTRKDYPSLAHREEVHFSSGSHSLAGYLYTVPSPKAVVVMCHGLNTMADGGMALIQSRLVEASYDVFSFDLTAHGRSEGEGIAGLTQSTSDTLAAISFVESLDTLSDKKTLLFGHSIGAYGVVTASGKTGVDGVCALSAFNDPADEMIAMAKSKAGSIVEATRFFMETAMQSKYGKECRYKASDAVASNPETKYFIVQGGKDATVPYDISLFKALDSRGDENVAFSYLEDYGHVSLWKTLEAIGAEESYVKTYNEKEEYRKDQAAQDAYVATLDLNASSAANEPLLSSVVSFYDSCL